MKAQMELSALRVIVNATKEFTSPFNNARPIYQYIRLAFSAESKEVTAVAVDGYRMSVEHSICMSVDADFVVFIKPHLPYGGKNAFAIIELKDGYAYINVDGNVTGYAQPEGEFINWKASIPTSEPKYRIGFNGLYMLSALRAAKISARNIFRSCVVLEFRGQNEPIILRTGDNGKNIKIVLPVRLGENEKAAPGADTPTTAKEN